MPFAKFIKNLKTNLDEEEITLKLLRKIGAKHISMVHAGPNSTPQHLDNLSRIALRPKIIRHDARKNYALGDPKSKKELKSELETSDGSKLQTWAS
jgi:agmatine/peptidylarginine deiminase